MRAWFAGVLFGAMMLAGGAACSSDDDDGGSSGATGQCQTIANNLCDEYVACEPSASKSQCTSELSAAIGCSNAVGVGESYDQCLDEIGDGTCEQVLAGEIPDSCRGVVLVDEGG